MEKKNLRARLKPDEVIRKMEKKKLRARGREETADIEECYANALQANLEKIVDELDLQNSSLCETLVRGGHLTEQESQKIRSVSDRRDQVRALFSLIKGREKRNLKAFFDFIQDNHKNSKMASDMKLKFEQNLKEKLNSKLCVMCKIMKKVNVKYVIDGLSSQFIIKDGLYNDCLWTDRPTGTQDYLWKMIFDVLNKPPRGSSHHAYEALLRILKEKNHYSHLAIGLKTFLDDNNHKVKCVCTQETPLFNIQSFKSDQTPLAPKISDVEDNLNSGSDVYDEELNATEGMNNIAIGGQRVKDQERKQKKDDEYDSVGGRRHPNSVASDRDHANVNKKQDVTSPVLGATGIKENKKRESEDSKDDLPDMKDDDLVFETFYHRSGKEFQCIYQSGMRFYLDDRGSKEWKPFPKRWFNEGHLVTNIILKDEGQSSQTRAEASGTSARGDQLHPSKSGGGGDDREGFLMHPTKGRIPTYIFHKKHNVHMYLDKDTGSWVRMPIAWELHHPMVKSLVEQVEEAVPTWGDRHDILSLLRACNYDPDECISIYKHLERDEWMKASRTTRQTQASDKQPKKKQLKQP